jgi:hypothetical protein
VASQRACPVGVSLSCSPDHRLTGTRRLANRTPQWCDQREAVLDPTLRPGGKTLAQAGKQVSGGLGRKDRLVGRGEAQGGRPR